MQFICDDDIDKDKLKELDNYIVDKQTINTKFNELIVDSLPDKAVWAIFNTIMKKAFIDDISVKDYDLKSIDFHLLKRAIQHYHPQFEYDINDNGYAKVVGEFNPIESPALINILDIIEIWNGNKPNRFKPSKYQP